MQIYSTTETQKNQRITVLAIVETVLASVIAVVIAIYFGTTAYYAIAVCGLPTMLLRTEKSARRAQLWFLWFVTALFRRFPFADKPNLLDAAKMVAVAVITPSASIITRTLATFATLFTNFLLSISSIPKNWKRVCFETDFFSEIELVPGRWLDGNEGSGSLEFWRSVTAPRTHWLGWILFVAEILLFLPFFVFRFSMKSTAFVYLPILWIASSTFEISDLKGYLKRFRESEFQILGLIYSIGFLLFMLAKLILLTVYKNFADWWNANPVAEFFSTYVVPSEFPIWQLASSINAVLFIVLWVLAKSALLRMDTVDAWSAKVVEHLYRGSSFVRGILTSYAVSITVYLTVEVACKWSLPPLGTKLFPWGD